MKSREQSLNEFCYAIDELQNVEYLLADVKLLKVTNAISNSKLLTDEMNYFCEDFDFHANFQNCFKIDGGVKHFVLPEKNTDAIAFVYLLIREIVYKRIEFTAVLDYFGGNKNYEDAYLRFIRDAIMPFRACVYQATMQVIQATSKAEEVGSKIETVEVSVKEEEPENPQVEQITNNKVDFKNQELTLLRLLDLDKLAINQSRASEDEKKDLYYVHELFVEQIKNGDAEKIKLSYLAYYYAMNSLKKVVLNIKDITKILADIGVLN